MKLSGGIVAQMACSLVRALLLVVVLYLTACAGQFTLWSDNASVPPDALSLNPIRFRDLPYLVAAAQSEENKSQLTDTLDANAPSVDSDTFVVEKMEEVISRYLAAMELLDADEAEATALRLGELYMRKADLLVAIGPLDATETANQKAAHSASGKAIQDLINHNTWFLQHYPGHKNNDYVLYQLGKGYEYQQNLATSVEYLSQLTNDYPKSRYYEEAQFRRGEYFFSLGEYQSAQSAFASAAINRRHALFDKSLYMLGWSYFKQGEFERTLTVFTEFLDKSARTSDFNTLTPAQNAVIADAIRVMVFSFGYLQGVESLKSHFNEHADKIYEPWVYRQYIDMLRVQERDADAIEVAQAFVGENPQHPDAAAFYFESIRLSVATSTPTKLIEQKAVFVSLYGIHGPYGMTAPSLSASQTLSTSQASSTDNPNFDLETELENYLQDLANYYYIDATKGAPNSNKSEKSYLQAAAYYQQYIDSFPLRTNVSAMHFMLGESLFGAKQWSSAATQYLFTAYELPPHPKQVDAGYAAVIALENQVRMAGSAGEKQLLQEPLLASEIMFVENFYPDVRAYSVAANAMDLALLLEQEEKAIYTADLLLHNLNSEKLNLPQSKPKDAADFYKSAMINKTNALFRLQRFTEAEVTAIDTLASLSPDDKNRLPLKELLASAIYKQADTLIASNEPMQAVERLSHIVVLAPESSVAPIALYDAAGLLLEQSQWSLASVQLESFLQHYRYHSLAADVPPRLVFAYEQSGNWPMAAKWMAYQMQFVADPAVKSVMLLRTAQLFDKAGHVEMAIAHYRDYAHHYLAPMSELMLARGRLVEIYGKQNETAKQRFWVDKVLSDYASRPELVDSQSISVVRQAAVIEAKWQYDQYRHTGLTFPLNKTIKKKKVALAAAVTAYETLASVGDETQNNQAVFMIGEIYRNLANDIIGAETPKTLNKLELSQYEVLLEELAYPFEEQAIAVHELNAGRIPGGQYDQWTKKSLEALVKLMPARYNKQESGGQFSVHLL